jgi:hypothetical protein
MTVKCIKDWPSHFVRVGDLCKFEPCSNSFCVKFPLMGWTSIGERKFKRHFVIAKAQKGEI